MAPDLRTTPGTVCDNVSKTRGISVRCIGSQNKQGEISQAIAAAILDRSIVPGTELVQNDLAEELGTSRIPVREALITLELSGLVERLPNNHCVVVDLDGMALDAGMELVGELEAKVLLEAEPWRGGSVKVSFDTEMDELSFHHALANAAVPGLVGRTLRRGIETLVTFALGCDCHDAEAGIASVLEAEYAARMGDDGRARAALQAYFTRLAIEIRGVRER